MKHFLPWEALGSLDALGGEERTGEGRRGDREGRRGDMEGRRGEIQNFFVVKTNKLISSQNGLSKLNSNVHLCK